MNIFIDNLDNIKKIAKKISKKYNNYFEVDELVNISYIKLDKAIKNNPSLIEGKFASLSTFLLRIKYDMLEYVRVESKIRKKQRLKDKGQVVPTFTSISFHEGYKESQGSFLKHSNTEFNYKDIDNKDYIEKLLQISCLTDDEWAIIQGYFYDEKPLKEVGQIIGVNESSICEKRKKMYKKCLLASENML